MRIVSLILVAVMMVGLAACGGTQPTSESAVQETEAEVLAAAEEAPEPTETPTPTPEPTPEPSPEPTETPEPTPEPGPYSDPAAFAGFDRYIPGFVSSYDAFMYDEITIGETVFGDLSYSIDRAKQFEDDAHEAVNNAETLEPGAIGRIDTNYWTKDGGQISYNVYNPSDTPAAFEDCVIIGFADEEVATFSNGIQFTYGISLYNNSIVEDITAILGEPNNVLGDDSSATYYWRDENSDHVLMLAIRTDGDSVEVCRLTYTNSSIVG